jgi:hypothetical protein
VARGVTCRQIAQSINMIIEFIMLFAVLKAGTSLFISNLDERIHPLDRRRQATSQLDESSGQNGPYQVGGPKVEPAPKAGLATEAHGPFSNA